MGLGLYPFCRSISGRELERGWSRRDYQRSGRGMLEAAALWDIQNTIGNSGLRTRRTLYMRECHPSSFSLCRFTGIFRAALSHFTTDSKRMGNHTPIPTAASQHEQRSSKPSTNQCGRQQREWEVDLREGAGELKLPKKAIFLSRFPDWCEENGGLTWSLWKREIACALSPEGFRGERSYDQRHVATSDCSFFSPFLDRLLRVCLAVP